MEDELDVVIDKCRYWCQDTLLTVYKKALFSPEKSKVLFQSQISDIEIVFYVNNKTPQMYFVTPEMKQSYFCYTTNDPDHCVEQLYNYFIAHGAVERLLGRFQAAMTKHSSTIAREKQQKLEQREQAKIARAVEHQKKQAERQKAADVERKRRGCKVVTEEQYTCLRCARKWYISRDEQLVSAVNALNVLSNRSVYSANNLKQSNKCPQCGSTASTHKTVKIWVDRKGNAVDFEE